MKKDPAVGKNSGKKILAMGELLIDLIPARDNMRICEAGPVLKTASGSAGIFACAAQRLGGNAGFIGRVGRDSLSAMAASALSGQGVDVSHLTVSDEGQIGLAFLEYLPEGRNYEYYRRNSVGSMLCADDVSEDSIAGAYAVHYPGMLLELTPQMRGACKKLITCARSRGVLVSFDPNIRREISADIAARERMLEAVRNADIVSPTLDEGRTITGRQSIGDVLRALHGLGPEVVALTRDKDGVVLSRDGEVATAEGINVVVSDPTGAGDTLAAALCVGLREGMPLEKLACFCNCAGTLETTKKGAIGMALPSREEVDAMVQSGVCRVVMNRLEDLP